MRSVSVNRRTLGAPCAGRDQCVVERGTDRRRRDRPPRARPRGEAGSSAPTRHRLERRAACTDRDTDEIDRDRELGEHGIVATAGPAVPEAARRPLAAHRHGQPRCPITRAERAGHRRAGRVAIARVRRVISMRRYKPSTAPAATIPQPSATREDHAGAPAARMRRIHHAPASSSAMPGERAASAGRGTEQGVGRRAGPRRPRTRGTRVGRGRRRAPSTAPGPRARALPATTAEPVARATRPSCRARRPPDRRPRAQRRVPLPPNWYPPRPVPRPTSRARRYRRAQFDSRLHTRRSRR